MHTIVSGKKPFTCIEKLPLLICLVVFMGLQLAPSCNARMAQGEDNHLQVVEATRQKWSGGRIESGHGVQYKITLHGGAGRNVTYKLWVDSFYVDMKVVDSTEAGGIMLYGNLRFPPKDLPYLSEDVKARWAGKAPVKQAPPVPFTGAGLLEVNSGDNKNIYIVISSFKELEPLQYP